MVIIIPGIIVVIISLYYTRKFFTKRLQVIYEKSLLKGDEENAVRSGKNYYLSLDEATLKAKGIVDIEARILEDFRAFNSRTYSILF
jgi:hypothetical protein